MPTPIIIRNNLIPVKGYAAINLFGVFFVRKDARIDPILINHELIHTRQMRETLYIGFYILYLIFYLLLLFRHRFHSHTAYLHIPFEREAYAHQHDLSYLNRRPLFNWLNIRKKQ